MLTPLLTTIIGVELVFGLILWLHDHYPSKRKNPRMISRLM
jgi:hypothetical protein